MKTYLHVLAVLLTGIFVIFMISCDRDETETNPTEKEDEGEKVWDASTVNLANHENEIISVQGTVTLHDHWGTDKTLSLIVLDNNVWCYFARKLGERWELFRTAMRVRGIVNGRTVLRDLVMQLLLLVNQGEDMTMKSNHC